MGDAQLPWTQARFRAEVAASAAAEDRERSTQLLALLQEQHAAYAECGAAEVSRRRGWILVELGNSVLDAEAVPLVLEELETGHVPYLLAAALRALRAAEAPLPPFAPPVLRALEALIRRDDLVDLSRWGGTALADDAGSALDEAMATLHWLGQHAQGGREVLQRVLAGPNVLNDGIRQSLERVLQALPEDGGSTIAACCSIPLPWRRWAPRAVRADVDEIRFEDQEGAKLSWGDFFLGQPTVVAFFYTRCDNELKCSLTISKLAQVQRLLQARGLESDVQLAAITYDPDFDLPARLHGYAESRGLAPGPHCRILRTTLGRELLQRHFSSGVNFAGSLVNRHRIEVFVLDGSGQIFATYQRLGWNADEVVGDARAAREAPLAQPSGASAPVARAAAGSAPVLWGLVLALLPKCPICGATYLSVTGLAALPYLPGWTGAWPAVALLLVLNLAALAWLSRGKRQWAPLACSAAGAATILGPGLAMGNDLAMLLGVAAMAFGAAWAVRGASAWPFKRKAATCAEPLPRGGVRSQ